MSGMEKSRFRQYDRNNLQIAVEEIKNGGKLREICRRYGVPKSTVLDRIKGRVAETCKRMGPDPVLTTNYEKELCSWVTDMAKCGFPLKKQELLQSVKKIVKEQNLKTPFKNNQPGERWYCSFLKRHPELVLKNGETLEKYRAQITEEYIRAWFRDLELFLTESNALDILDEPSRILNGDETGFSLCPKTGKVLSLKGKNQYVVKKGCEKENLTVLITFTADGRLCPPVVVFPYVRPPRTLVESVPVNWILGKSETGWTRSDVFYEFVANGLNDWLKKEKIQKPVLFVVDGRRSHMSLELSKFCSDNGIILYALPPNATHLLQPADVAVFKPLKEYWRQEVRTWQSENVNGVVTKSDFCPIFEKVLQNPKLSSYFKNGFKVCGLYPFNPNKVDYSKCVQNILENLNINNMLDKSEDVITEGDIRSAEKVILKIRAKLEEAGIDTNLVLTSVKSLRQQNVEILFSEEDMEQMEIIFDDDIISNGNVLPNTNEISHTSKTVVLQNTILNSSDIEEIVRNPIDIDKENTLGKTEEKLNRAERFEKEKVSQNDEESEESDFRKPKVDEQLDVINSIAEECSVDPEEQNLKQDNVELNRSEELIQNKDYNRVDENPSGADIKQLTVGNAFRKHLLFLKPIEKSTIKRKREKMPSAISSEAWRKHYQEKGREKENKKNAKPKKRSGKNKPLMVTHNTPIENQTNKQQCAICEEDLESDTDIENEKNVGCDVCPRWFHLGCTKFIDLPYNEVAKAEYVCDYCEHC